MLDCGANVFCVSERVAAMTKRHVVACDTYIKTFGDTTVTVSGVINDFPLTFCRGTPDEVTIYLTALVYSCGSTRELLLGMPVMNHHALYLAPCAFFGAVLMWPELQYKDKDYIMSLPAAERAQHMGRVVFLPASMTEAEHAAHNAQSVVVCVADATAAHNQVCVADATAAHNQANSGSQPGYTLAPTADSAPGYQWDGPVQHLAAATSAAADHAGRGCQR